jgi:uncharacterized protein involved in outer membrane biogenesis
MHASASGEITQLLLLDGIDIRLTASGKELSEVGLPAGASLAKLGPFNFDGTLTGSAKAISSDDFTVAVAKSDFKGSAKIEFGKRPKISLQLESEVVDFSPFLKKTELDIKEQTQAHKEKQHLFSDEPLPFDVLKTVDADIELKARNIHVRDSHFEFGHLSLNLLNGNLSLDSLEATYRNAKITGHSQLNLLLPARVEVEFLVQDFNLGKYLREQGVSDEIRAHVDIAALGNSRGNSVRALMSNLDGTIGAVMGKGHLTRYLDLISVDLSQKVIQFWGKHREAGEIKCAAVEFDIEGGVATSKVFVFDSQIAILTAKGSIDLASEKVDFLLDPKPKQPGLMNLSTKLRVTGSILDPKVRPDMVSLAIKAGEALSFLVVGPIGLLAPFVHLGAHEKHPCDIQSIRQPEPKHSPTE